MPKALKIDKLRVIEACEAAYANKKPNLSKITQEYWVLYEILHGQFRQGKQARSAQKPINKALSDYQEEALIQWVIHMRDLYIPVTPDMLTE